MSAPRQIPLPLEHRPAVARADFLVSPCNRDALAAVDGWRHWPGAALVLSGPARAGKSHLASVWCAQVGARALTATELAEAGPDALARGPRAIEDAPVIAGDAQAERTLLHLVNLMRAGGHPLLLTGRGTPAQWGLELPDLASRLSALGLARIGAPDDAVLSAVLVKLATDRGIEIAPNAVSYCLTRMERSFAAAEDLVAALDRASLARRRPVTRALAAELLASPET